MMKMTNEEHISNIVADPDNYSMISFRRDEPVSIARFAIKKKGAERIIEMTHQLLAEK